MPGPVERGAEDGSDPTRRHDPDGQPRGTVHRGPQTGRASDETREQAIEWAIE
ncbi:hypothetical protein Acsp05_39780 [Actinokineospora sp. NBRC 105648]|nr:hypothetical protein Acsp05_39780 [Actinokineospora sp. NBRC 105648]